MKRRLLCFLLVVVCLFAGCTGMHIEAGTSEKPVIDSPVYDWGINLTAEAVTAKGLTLVCTQNGGEAQGELQTGSWYEIQKSENGIWKKVKYTEIEEELVGWTGEAWCIPKDSTVKWEVNWSWLYDELPAGEYRIGKEIMDFMETGRYDKTVIYAEFTIQ